MGADGELEETIGEREASTYRLEGRLSAVIFFSDITCILA